MSVSVVEETCGTATNNLKVIYNKEEKKKDFVVCVKSLTFPANDVSARLDEWIVIISSGSRSS